MCADALPSRLPACLSHGEETQVCGEQLQVLCVCLVGKNHLAPAAARVYVFVEVVAPATMAAVCGKGLVECVRLKCLLFRSAGPH